MKFGVKNTSERKHNLLFYFIS